MSIFVIGYDVGIHQYWFSLADKYDIPERMTVKNVTLNIPLSTEAKPRLIMIFRRVTVLTITLSGMSCSVYLYKLFMKKSSIALIWVGRNAQS